MCGPEAGRLIAYVFNISNLWDPISRQETNFQKDDYQAKASSRFGGEHRMRIASGHDL